MYLITIGIMVVMALGSVVLTMIEGLKTPDTISTLEQQKQRSEAQANAWKQIRVNDIKNNIAYWENAIVNAKSEYTVKWANVKINDLKAQLETMGA
jgi:hypothetical protein